jgi:predicted alpha/beta-hydrolase family hydrolase
MNEDFDFEERNRMGQKASRTNEGTLRKIYYNRIVQLKQKSTEVVAEGKSKVKYLLY